MSRSTEQKIKLLVLYEILYKNTDEERTMTTGELIASLKEKGIEVSRKTLYEDIEALNKYGYEVMCDKSRSNRYYVSDRKFERTEIQFLLNAIGVSHALTDQKTTVLIEKLLELVGISEADQLNHTISISDKHGNERIYYSIDAITTAILKRKKLSFLYFDYDENCKRVYRKERSRYKVNPLGITYYGDNLYMICYHDNHADTANYRIDRMDETQVEQEEILCLEKYEDFDIKSYRQRQFGMFVGEQTEVKLTFPKEMIEVAIDRFGENISPKNIGDDQYLIKVTIQVSKLFFSWLTSFEGKVGIQSPLSVRDEYRNFLKNNLEHIKSFEV